MKTAIAWMLSLFLICTILGSPADAASSKGSFSGKTSSHSSTSSTFSGSKSSPSYSSNSNANSAGKTYSSGSKAPSSNVTQNSKVQPPAAAQPKSHWGSFIGGLAAGAVTGALLGHLFHPFGGNGYGGFSFLSLIIWLVIIFLVYKLIRRLLWR